MRTHAQFERRSTSDDLCRRVWRLEHLPFRPATARALLDGARDGPLDESPEDLIGTRTLPVLALDPGWCLALLTGWGPSNWLELIAERPWWPPSATTGPSAEFLDRLWRHSVAVGVAARLLGREADAPGLDELARAGRLCNLGLWAVAAVDPEWALQWWRCDGADRRASKARADLGMGLDDLGRRLAERWGADPLAVDAAWLCSDPHGALNSAADCPERLAVLQQAYQWAEQTPWSLGRAEPGPNPGDPRLRIVTAEVQARCVGPFVDADSTPREERLSRQNARMRSRIRDLGERREHCEQFVRLLAGSRPDELPEEWADRASLAWCSGADISAARVVWRGEEERRPHAEGPPAADQTAPTPAVGVDREIPREGLDRPRGRGPSAVLPLETGRRVGATVELWRTDSADGRNAPLETTTRRAWEAWAALLADRARLERRLQAAVEALRRQAETEEERLRLEKLDGLAEFAAGAGHELNNPLAVIAGRAQLLAARAESPEAERSLRIILGQTRRAHRILRDLMFVARPPAPRNRTCRPPELLEKLLREFEGECGARGVRLVSEVDAAPDHAWTDPDALRHLAEALLQNALRTTPSGGRIQVRSSWRNQELVWTFSDTGRGIGASEAGRLFDPFYCGRQAGRGLGLGLPRAAKIVELAGGRLRWASNPGRETTFQVHLPLATAPKSA